VQPARTTSMTAKGATVRNKLALCHAIARTPKALRTNRAKSFGRDAQKTLRHVYRRRGDRCLQRWVAASAVCSAEDQRSEARSISAAAWSRRIRPR